jgi:acylphosphatase
MRSVSLIVRGKVQGVYYRAKAEQKALSLGLVGHVKNLKDGGVYLEIHGPEDAVQNMVDWCGKGPVMARVREVIVSPIEHRDLSVFEIEY